MRASCVKLQGMPLIFKVVKSLINPVSEKISKQVHFYFFRSDRKRTANGTERIPNGLRTKPERTTNGLRTDPEQTPNGSRTNPERIPNGPRTETARTPHGLRANPIYSETPFIQTAKRISNGRKIARMALIWTKI